MNLVTPTGKASNFFCGSLVRRLLGVEHHQVCCMRSALKLHRFCSWSLLIFGDLKPSMRTIYSTNNCSLEERESVDRTGCYWIRLLTVTRHAQCVILVVASRWNNNTDVKELHKGPKCTVRYQHKTVVTLRLPHLSDWSKNPFWHTNSCPPYQPYISHHCSYY